MCEVGVNITNNYVKIKKTYWKCHLKSNKKFRSKR